MRTKEPTLAVSNFCSVSVAQILAGTAPRSCLYIFRILFFFSFSLCLLCRSLRAASGLHVFSLLSTNHLFSVCGFRHLEHWAVNMQVIFFAGLDKLLQIYPRLSAISIYFYSSRLEPLLPEIFNFHVIPPYRLRSFSFRCLSYILNLSTPFRVLGGARWSVSHILTPFRL